MLKLTNEGHYPTLTRQLGEFLYIRKERVENNLFVKYYMRMANFNKVIKLLKFKSALFPMGGAIKRPTEGDFCTLSICASH